MSEQVTLFRDIFMFYIIWYDNLYMFSLHFSTNVLHFFVCIWYKKHFTPWHIHSVTLVLKLGYINLPWGSQYLAWKTLCSILNDYLQKTTPIYFPCQLFWQRKRMRKVYGVCDLIATKICTVKCRYDILRMWI